MARKKKLTYETKAEPEHPLSLYDECFEFKSLKIKSLTNILHPSLPWKSSITPKKSSCKIIKVKITQGSYSTSVLRVATSTFKTKTSKNTPFSPKKKCHISPPQAQEFASWIRLLLICHVAHQLQQFLSRGVRAVLRALLQRPAGTDETWCHLVAENQLRDLVLVGDGGDDVQGEETWKKLAHPWWFSWGSLQFFGEKNWEKKMAHLWCFLGEVFNILGKNIRESLIILTYHQA